MIHVRLKYGGAGHNRGVHWSPHNRPLFIHLVPSTFILQQDVHGIHLQHCHRPVSGLKTLAIIIFFTSLSPHRDNNQTLS